jgi:hypothetical protein
MERGGREGGRERERTHARKRGPEQEGTEGGDSWERARLVKVDHYKGFP